MKRDGLIQMRWFMVLKSLYITVGSIPQPWGNMLSLVFWFGLPPPAARGEERTGPSSQGPQDPNAPDSGGWTALQCAAQGGHVEVVRFLAYYRPPERYRV